MLTECKDLSPVEREDAYYRLLAGLAGASLLESAHELKLFELLAQKGPLTSDEVSAHLVLQPQRTRKWLLALRYVDLLEEAPGQHDRQPRYKAGPLARALFHKDGEMGWFYQDFLRFTRKVYDLDLAQVLRGLPIPQVPYPPQELADTEALESWMRATAEETAGTIEKTLTLHDVRRLLDVAGGDGTMALYYARHYPQLSITVFNLPNSAYLARQNVARAGLGDRIDVVEGDFRRDPLPQGYDLVQFSRVLADWPEDVCRMLLAKARHALVPGGRLLICEPLADDNPDLALAWEYGYLPYDDFGAALYKPLATYQRLLAEAGFNILKVTRKTPMAVHSVMVAQRG